MSSFLGSGNKSDKKENKNKPRYQGRFVKESLGDKHQVKPAQTFSKQWTFRNGGDVAWPQDVVFMQTSGDMMGAVTKPISKVVLPGEDYVWEMLLNAPEQAGRYTAYFRM